jgi:hypothetical protein
MRDRLLKTSLGDVFQRHKKQAEDLAPLPQPKLLAT